MKCLLIIYNSDTSIVYNEYGFTKYLVKRFKNVQAQDNVAMCTISLIERSWKHFWYCLLRKTKTLNR